MSMQKSLYRAIFEQSLDAQILINASTGLIQDVSFRFEQLFGYKPKQILGKSLQCILPEYKKSFPVKNATDFDVFDGVFQSQSFLCSDGTERQLDLTASILNIDEEKIVLATFRAIDEREKDRAEFQKIHEAFCKSENEQRRYGEQLTAFIQMRDRLASADSIPDLEQKVLIESHQILTFDRLELWYISDNKKHLNGACCIDHNGKIKDIENARIKVLSNSAEETITKNVESQVIIPVRKSDHERSGGKEQQRILTTVSCENKIIGCLILFQKPDDPTYTPQDYKMLRLIGDYMGQLLTYKKMEDARGRLATTVEQLAESVVISDMDGKIEYVNPAFECTSGYKFQEVYGKTQSILKSGLHSESLYDDIRHTVREGTVWRGRIINKNKAGEEHHEDMSVSPIRNHSGNIVNMVSIKRDVTQEILLERQLNNAQKMEAIGTMAGGIAHDFNNILAPIQGYVEMALEDIESNLDSHSYLIQVNKAVGRAKELVNQILTFSRQSDLDLKPINLSHIVGEALKLIRASIPATIPIHYHTLCLSADTVIFANSTQIHQVIMNLCTNAWHSIEKNNGVITINLDQVDVGKEKSQLCQNLKEGSYLQLSIIDNGCGMDKDLMDRVFEPFFTTKKAGKGTGMGLSTCHGIITSLGGKISIESELNLGSTFHVFIPRYLKGEIEKYHKEIKPIHGNETIMFVDDESEIVKMFEIYLKGIGYNVLSFVDSNEAFDFFKNKNAEIDIVITDQTMPNKTGLEMAQSMREIRPELPIIICSGFSDQLDNTQLEKINIPNYLKKPIKPRLLAEKIREILD